jgi:hypothetical protein
VTGELDKLAFRTRTMAMIKYTLPMVHVCALNMLVNLSFVLHIVILCPYNVLHVAQALKNLASVHRITSDNNVYFQLDPNFFFYQGPGVKENMAPRQG